MPSADDLLELHRRMLLIRGFEEGVAVLYRSGEVPGFVHLSIGQEASAVGAHVGSPSLDTTPGRASGCRGRGRSAKAPFV